MRDSYQKFFEYFKIEFQDIIKFGMEIDTIFPEPTEIKKDWEELLSSIKNNKPVYIRGYGRDAHGTNLYQKLYEILLSNSNIRKDSTNNAKPTQLLQKITKYSKSIKKDSLKKEIISNYQVTHIFGRTKNPFLFTAPWNIVWKSKILDPFTGHESIGENTENYKREFLEISKLKYSDFIEEYNEIVSIYFTEEKIENAFKKMNNDSIDTKIFEKFKIDAKNELRAII